MVQKGCRKKSNFFFSSNNVRRNKNPNEYWHVTGGLEKTTEKRLQGTVRSKGSKWYKNCSKL
jgi:hypothetical protein